MGHLESSHPSAETENEKVLNSCSYKLESESEK